jgi:hypothetical protein
MHTPRVPQPAYTGEGFKGEKWLAVTAVIITIVSSAMLIHLTGLQRQHTRMQIAELKRKAAADGVQIESEK